MVRPINNSSQQNYEISREMQKSLEASKSHMEARGLAHWHNDPYSTIVESQFLELGEMRHFPRSPISDVHRQLLVDTILDSPITSPINIRHENGSPMGS